MFFRKSYESCHNEDYQKEDHWQHKIHLSSPDCSHGFKFFHNKHITGDADLHREMEEQRRKWVRDFPDDPHCVHIIYAFFVDIFKPVLNHHVDIETIRSEVVVKEFLNPLFVRQTA